MRQFIGAEEDDIVELFISRPGQGGTRTEMTMKLAMELFMKLPSDQQNNAFIIVGPPEKVVVDGNEVWLNVIPKEGVLDLVARNVFSDNESDKLN